MNPSLTPAELQAATVFELRLAWHYPEEKTPRAVIAHSLLEALRAAGLRIIPEGEMPREAAVEMLRAFGEVIESLDPRKPRP